MSSLNETDRHGARVVQVIAVGVAEVEGMQGAENGKLAREQSSTTKSWRGSGLGRT
jgi:hypothetical protein